VVVYRAGSLRSASLTGSRKASKYGFDNLVSQYESASESLEALARDGIPARLPNSLHESLGADLLQIVGCLTVGVVGIRTAFDLSDPLGKVGDRETSGLQSKGQESFHYVSHARIVQVHPRYPRGANLGRLGQSIQRTFVEEVDVRNQADYHGEQGHITQASLIPLEELTSRIDELAEHKDKTIVTICRTDKRSTKAAELLHKSGFTHVQVVKMGMSDWNANGFPVEH